LTPPSSATEVANYVLAAPDKKMGLNLHANTGHTEWPDGAAHHSGFTTTLTPNTNVEVVFAGNVYQHCDFNSQSEGRHLTNPTCAAITARSYHNGNLVTIGLMDGSVRAVSGGIDLPVWRGLGTRNGGEALGLW
jgi:hypothetical protein